MFDFDQRIPLTQQFLGLCNFLDFYASILAISGTNKTIATSLLGKVDIVPASSLGIGRFCLQQLLCRADLLDL